MLGAAILNASGTNVQLRSGIILSGSSTWQNLSRAALRYNRGCRVNGKILILDELVGPLPSGGLMS